MEQQDGYKWLIDQLVEMSNLTVTANRIHEYGHAERPGGLLSPLSGKEKKRKQFLQGLDKENREIVVALIEEERISAVHDVASFLDRAISIGTIQLSINDHQITGSPYWSLHHDFMYRRDEEGWPDE